MFLVNSGSLLYARPNPHIAHIAHIAVYRYYDLEYACLSNWVHHLEVEVNISFHLCTILVLSPHLGILKTLGWCNNM